MANIRRYPVLLPTVRMKAATHNVIIKDLKSDQRTVTHPIQGFVLSLCNGTMDAEAIARCVATAYHYDYEKALEGVKYILDKRRVRLMYQDEPILRENLYGMEDFFYTPKPIPEDGRLEKPTSATFTLTHNCNYRCRYCYNSSAPGKREGDMTTENWLDLIDELKSGTDCFLVNLTGGEPMTHPGFFPILESLHSGGILTDISTNGSLIDGDAIKRFLDLEQYVMLISLDSPYPDVHHSMTGSSGSFPKVIRAIEKMVEAGIAVNIKSLLLPDNYQSCGELALLMDKLGVQGQMFDTYHMDPGGRGNTAFWLTNEQCAQVDDILDEITPKLKNGLKFQFTPPRVGWKTINECTHCGGLSSGFGVLPDGRFSFCEGLFPDAFFSLGRYPEMSVMDMWRSDKAHRILNPPLEVYSQTCRECESFENCRSGCFKSKLIVKADRYGIDPSCPMARYDNNPLVYREGYERRERWAE